MLFRSLSTNLISFVLVRRGEWFLKVSVYKNKYIMVVAQHVFDMEHTIIRFFLDQNQAADNNGYFVAISYSRDEINPRILEITREAR